MHAQIDRLKMRVLHQKRVQGLTVRDNLALLVLARSNDSGTAVVSTYRLVLQELVVDRRDVLL